MKNSDQLFVLSLRQAITLNLLTLHSLNRMVNGVLGGQPLGHAGKKKRMNQQKPLEILVRFLNNSTIALSRASRSSNLCWAVDSLSLHIVLLGTPNVYKLLEKIRRKGQNPGVFLTRSLAFSAC